MYKKIVVAFNQSAEASRAMAAAIHLAKALRIGLDAVSILDRRLLFASFAASAGSSLAQTLIDDMRERYEQLQSQARDQALRDGVQLVTHILEGDEVDAIVDFALRQKADLLVIGLQQHSLYISRLWSSVYAVAVAAPCSVLGVH